MRLESKGPTDRGLEGPEAERLGSQIYSLGSPLLVQDGEHWETGKEEISNPKATYWSELGKW